MGKYIVSKDMRLASINFIISTCLIIAGFIVPPTGIIDPSVLTACGILTVYPLILLGYKVIETKSSLSIDIDQKKLNINSKDE